MSPRVATTLLTTVLLVALVAVAWMVPVPFVAMSPGPTENTLGEVDNGEPIVEIAGHRTYPTSGQLDLTTVAVTPPNQRLDLPGVLSGWLDPRVAIVPYDYLYPGDESPEQVEQENAEQMELSQQSAIAAGLRQVGLKVTDIVVVGAVLEDAPAIGRLKAGDVILEVDGMPVTDAQSVADLVTEHAVGEDVTFSIQRDEKPLEVTITTTKAPDDPDRAMVGITPADSYDFPFDVTINLGQEIGGPSAGTMFALAIYDPRTRRPRTDGRHGAGTGTIDGDGNVGGIGGIQQKVRGAEEKGAEVFLVPDSNCGAAADAGVSGIRLVRVATLADAVDALDTLRKGGTDIPACEG
jgi:PDZ domain-containing protein